MDRLILAAALVLLAAAVAVAVRRRRPAPPTQPRAAAVPSQLDRADFDGASRPWLVAVFTSRTCGSCEGALEKAAVLACEDVVVMEVPWQERRELHDRYGVAIVPTIVVADREGVVRASFVGTPSAADLWAAVAEARQPGSSPEPDLGRSHPEPPAPPA